MAERTRQRAFIKLAAFGWFRDSECVGGIENRIAKQKIDGTVELRRSAFRNNFKPCPARPRKSRRVRILVNLHFLNAGGRNAGAICLHAVDYERYSVCASSVV